MRPGIPGSRGIAKRTVTGGKHCAAMFSARVPAGGTRSKPDASARLTRRRWYAARTAQRTVPTTRFYQTNPNSKIAKRTQRLTSGVFYTCTAQKHMGTPVTRPSNFFTKRSHGLGAPVQSFRFKVQGYAKFTKRTHR